MTLLKTITAASSLALLALVSLPTSQAEEREPCVIEIECEFGFFKFRCTTTISGDCQGIMPSL